MPSSRETPVREWWQVFDPRSSLRARAALLFGASAALFVALVTWFAGQSFRRTLQQQTGAQFESLAFQIGDKLDRVLYERQHQLQFVSRLPAFLASPPGPDGAAPRRQVLEALQAEVTDFAWIGFADTAGKITSATQERFEGVAVSNRPWFRGARELPFAGTLHEIPELPRGLPGIEDDARNRYLDLAVPVSGSAGQDLGVLGAHLRWNWAGDVARSAVSAAEQRNQIGVTVYGGDTEVLLDTGATGWTVPPNAPALPGSRVFRGFIFENFAAHTQYLTGFARSRGFRDYRGLGWLVTVRQPVELAFAPVVELQRRIARWGIGFSFALMIGSWFFVTPFVRRLQGVRAAANRIRGGDILTVMPRHQGETEMSAMCESLGTLVEDLRAQRPQPPVEPPSAVAPPESSYHKPTGSDPRRVVW